MSGYLVQTLGVFCFYKQLMIAVFMLFIYVCSTYNFLDDILFLLSSATLFSWLLLFYSFLLCMSLNVFSKMAKTEILRNIFNFQKSLWMTCTWTKTDKFVPKYCFFKIRVVMVIKSSQSALAFVIWVMGFLF